MSRLDLPAASHRLPRMPWKVVDENGVVVDGYDPSTFDVKRHRLVNLFSGDTAFEMVTTHGMPKEILDELLADRGITLDEAQYQKRMDEFREISRAGRTRGVFA